MHCRSLAAHTRPTHGPGRISPRHWAAPSIPGSWLILLLAAFPFRWQSRRITLALFLHMAVEFRLCYRKEHTAKAMPKQWTPMGTNGRASRSRPMPNIYADQVPTLSLGGQVMSTIGKLTKRPHARIGHKRAGQHQWVCYTLRKKVLQRPFLVLQVVTNRGLYSVPGRTK